MRKQCSIDGCDQPARKRGWCEKHYMQWYWKNGHDPSKYSENYHDRASDPIGLKRRLDKKWKLDHSTGCWQWIGAQTYPSSKYPYRKGRVFINKKSHTAHRLSWTIHRGPIPEGMHVLHTCDNSLCVNPDHLYLGDHAKNMDDMAKRGRAAQRKLTDEQVRFVRSSPLGAQRVANILGIDKSSVQAIRKMKCHKHVV